MINREIITRYQDRGYLVTIELCEPCLLCHVAGVELPNFYADTGAARAAATRYIDDQIKEQEKKHNAYRSTES